MSQLTKLFRISKVAKLNGTPAFTLVKNYSDMIIDDDEWKAGPYPKTQAQREAAAKKYGLPVELYEPYPDDGMGHGDYPKLPDISDDYKSPYYPWDFPEYKRNFNEPLHHMANIIGQDRIDISHRWRYSRPVQFLVFSTFIGTFIWLYWFFDDKRIYPSVAAKHLPSNGKVYYSFEPANS